MQEIEKGYTIIACMKNLKRLVMATLSVLIFLGACGSNQQAATEEQVQAEEQTGTEAAAPEATEPAAATEEKPAAHH